MGSHEVVGDSVSGCARDSGPVAQDLLEPIKAGSTSLAGTAPVADCINRSRPLGAVLVDFVLGHRSADTNEHGTHLITLLGEDCIKDRGCARVG